MLAHIDETAAKPAAAAAASLAREQPAPAPATKPASSEAPVTAVTNDIKATPVAAAIIADKKVAPASITPSGAGGKILKQDVLEALSHPGIAKQSFQGQDLFSAMSAGENEQPPQDYQPPFGGSKKYHCDAHHF